MFESLRMNIGVTFARMKLRSGHNPVISFTDVVTSARTVLVVLPLDKQELLSVMQLIELLKKTFLESDITVVGDERGLETKRLMPQSHFIQLRQTDVTTFFHPKQHFMRQVQSRAYDIAIDLNLDLVLPSAYICRESKARVCIGFAGPRADHFFNFQIHPDPAQSRNNIYDRVARCLEMF